MCPKKWLKNTLQVRKRAIWNKENKNVQEQIKNESSISDSNDNNLFLFICNACTLCGPDIFSPRRIIPQKEHPIISADLNKGSTMLDCILKLFSWIFTSTNLQNWILTRLSCRRKPCKGPNEWIWAFYISLKFIEPMTMTHVNPWKLQQLRRISHRFIFSIFLNYFSGHKINTIHHPHLSDIFLPFSVSIKEI